MKTVCQIVLCAILVFAMGAGALAQSQSGAQAVELTDSKGDVSPITTSGGEQPGFDVVKLSLTSDGQELHISAELNDPPGSFATSVLVLFFDVDQNPATGAQLNSYGKPKGFEYKGEVQVCIKYENGMTACSGGASKSKPVSRFSGVNLYRYEGQSESGKKRVLDSMGFPGRKPSLQIPITDRFVKSSIDYKDLGAKPGQTMRIVVSEACSVRHKSLFPEITLILK
jgi:hypothetical protein